MSRVGKHVTKDWKLEDIIDIVYDYGGIIKDIAEHLGVTRRTFYEYKDINPEIQEACDKADGHLDRHTVETSYKKLDKLIEEDIEDPALAFKAVTLALTKSKKSRYYQEKENNKEETPQLTPAQLAHYAKLSAEEAERNSKKDSE